MYGGVNKPLLRKMVGNMFESLNTRMTCGQTCIQSILKVGDIFIELHRVTQ